MALDKLVDSTLLDNGLTSIANAIRAKGGTSAALTYPTGFVTAIENIPTGDSGGNSGTGYDVVFYDDLANNGKGGIAAHYSASEFASLSAMPSNPDHSDYSDHGISIPMTSQGWNWSLADAKTYVAIYGKLNIGQMYVPTDGKSHYICYVPMDAPIERWNTIINISTTGSGVEWQIDNGELNSATGDINVTFPSTGWHDVKIQAKTGATYYPYCSGSSRTNEAIGKVQKIISIYLGNNVTQIGNNSFRQLYSLISFTMSDSVISVGNYTFSGCYSLTSITFPDSITSIGSSAFYYCYSLTSATLPDGITSIESNAFYYCSSLTSITIPDSVTIIGSSAFYYCYCLTSITLPDEVTNIGSTAFYNCHSLASITIPDSVTSIGNSAFYSCSSLTSITIPDSVISIGTNAFYYCYSLTSVTLSDEVTSIGNNAFYYCYSLTSITIPDKVTSIGNNAFSYCHSLTSITIPDSVTAIGSSAFADSYSLKNIIMLSSTPPTLSNINAFNNLMSDYSIIVPSGSKSSYVAETNWSSLADHIVEAT